MTKKNQQNICTNTVKNIDYYIRAYEYELDAHRKTRIKLEARERELHDITQSNSYKLAKILALSKHGARVLVNHAKELNPKRAKLILANRKHVKAVYSSDEFNNKLNSTPTSDLAVVIHLYYTDMFLFFKEKLESMPMDSYDLFITVPEGKEDVIDSILSYRPDARVVVVPNCGRDVLPFVEVIRHISKLGYVNVLKLHSKKSPHRKDGSTWRDKIVDSLVPASTEQYKDIITVLSKKNTAIIGPGGEYLSLLVNFSATGHYVKMLSGKMVDTKLAHDLVRVSDEYGFFAGTMFWARIDALMPIIDNVSAVDFEPELGQVDSTLAHALERLFNVIPELLDRDMYELKDGRLEKVDYHTTNIPEWSEIALDR